ncbi:MAG: hypothetical protein M3268_06415 [Acidobacteriota bacterium]|nr:hypothetical protein [Acidobacteriota bacterium]
MKTLTTNSNRFSARALRLFVCALAASILAAGAAWAQSTGGRDVWNWIRSDDNKKIEVRVEGKVEFNEDYSDVASIPSDGALRITDSRAGDTLRLSVTRGSDGSLLRDYTVNGARHDFDAGARAWLREVLLLAARQGGLDARERVRRIVARGGPRALIEEITHIEGDYSRRIYFDELLKIENLRDEDRRAALRDAAASIKSDYERSQLLQHVAGVYLAKGDLAPVFFEALAPIGSDYERHQVLRVAFKRADLSGESLTAAARIAASFTSDYERATFLAESAARFMGDARTRAAFFDALRTVKSDYEHHRVLSAVIKSPALGREALFETARSAADIKSDYEKASFLVEAASHYQSDEHLRAAFASAMRTIGSDYERGRVETRIAKMTTN